jgi:hypothetical protein
MSRQTTHPAPMDQTRNFRYEIIALALMAVVGVALIFIFPGSPEQDTDYHFLMARTAWLDHSYFVNVWGGHFLQLHLRLSR